MLNIWSKCKIKPAVCEVEFHPYLFQKDLKQFCDLENIRIFAYNPLTKGDYPKKINLQKKYEGYLEAPLHFLGQKYKLKRTKLIINWHMALNIIPILGIKIKNPAKLEDKMEIINNVVDNAIKETFIIEKIEFD